MPIALTPSTAATVFTVNGVGMSDSFSVAAQGTYTFSAIKTGNFSSLVFVLQNVFGYQSLNVATWDVVASPSFSFTLNPGATYRFSCTSFAGGTSALVTTRMQNGTTIVPSQIASFALNGWTPIVAPIDCDYYWVIENKDGSAMMRGSNPNDATTQYEISADESYALIVPPSVGNSPRFKMGDTVTYLQSTGGNGPAVVEFYL